MNSQQRYRTLISSIGKIYSADDTKTRSSLLESSLFSVMENINPHTDVGWSVVCSDSERILKVWETLEETPAAQVVVEQFKDILKEFGRVECEQVTEDDDMSGCAIQQIVAPQITPPSPALSHRSILETPSVHRQNTPSVSAIGTPILSAINNQTSVSTPRVASAPTSVTATPVLMGMTTVNIAKEQDLPIVSELIEAEAEAEAPIQAPSVSNKMEIDDIVEPEGTEDAGAVDAEEEEEEGAELETILIRGKTYYHDPGSGALYNILEDDDVGDEVGVMKDKKVQFFAK
jgi:predicted  nucleic acid-binding Zn-ribbon protein